MKKLLSNRIITYAFCSLIILSFLAWLGLIAVEGYDSEQINLFFLHTQDFLADFSNVVGYSSLRDPYNCTLYSGLAEKAYPPLCYLLMYFVSRTINITPYIEANRFLSMIENPMFLIVYFIYLIFCAITTYELIKEMKTGNKATKILFSITILVSRPFIFTIERGNLILLTILCVIYFVNFYDSEKQILRELSLIALAFASALKITPAFFGILLLIEKRWKDSLKVLLYGIVLCVVPFFFFENGINNIFYFIRNIGLQMEAYALNEGCTVNSFMFDYLGIKRTYSLNMIAKVISYFLCAIFVFNILKSEEKWLKVLCVALVIVIVPGHSEYYNVLFLIPAIVLFFNKNKFSLMDYLIIFSVAIMFLDLQTRFYKFLNYHISIFILVIYVLFCDIKKLTKLKNQNISVK